MDISRFKSFFSSLWGNLPWRLFFLLTLAILLLGFTISAKKQQLAAEKKEAGKRQVPPVNVETQRLSPLRMENAINLPAVVEAWEDLTVSAEVTGQIVTLEVAEGDPVKKGQVLARLDGRDYRHALQSAEAKQELARLNFERLQKLAGKQLVSQADLDQAEANLKEINAALADARLDLERTTITAPIAGIVNDLPARTGKFLAVDEPIAQILAIDRVKVEVAIPEADVAAVRRVDQGLVTLAALDDLAVTGKKIYLAHQPSSAAMAYPLRLAIDNPDHLILPGMFARAKIVKTVVDQAIGIPLYAVITRDAEKFVFVARDGVARKRKITTGFLQGWLVQVTNGLNPGEEVVIVGHRQLEDGQTIRVVRTVTDPGILVSQVAH